MAGAVHKGAGDLVCGSCHTMHNSQGGAGLGGNPGGSLVLLREQVNSRAETHKLCLQCHASNGTQAGVSHAPQNVIAPKVYSTGTWDDDMAFNAIGAGGNFSTELEASYNTTTPASLGFGHSLGATNVMPPGAADGDAALPYLTCITCHDPHGANTASDASVNMFRNLKVNAQGAGAHSGVKLCPDGGAACNSNYQKYKSYVGGINGAYFGGAETDNAGQVIWPVYRGATLSGVPATDAPNSNAYGAKSTESGNMSVWCSQCHDKWHAGGFGRDIDGIMDAYRIWDEDASLVAGGTWDRLMHPTSSVMPRRANPGCADGCHKTVLDRVNYSVQLIQDGKGIPVTASNYYGNDSVYYLPYELPAATMDATTSGHKVFCLSCHFAHGGPYYDALRWNYASAVSAGDQTGNVVPSNKGCQLCHNR